MKGRSFAFILFCFITCICNLANAQDIIAKGVLLEKGAKIRIALAEIENNRTKIGVGSNDLGFFQLKAQIGDTLTISKRNYIPQRVVVTSSSDLIIYMVRNVIELEEVTIKGQNKKQDLADIKRDFQNKGVYNGGKSSFLSVLFQPLNALYNLVGTEPKNARRFGRYADNELKQSQIDVYFNTRMIQNNTDLSGEKLERYMLDCRPEYEKAQYWNAYDYINYIKKSSKNFTDTLGKGK